jgi:hypothetical protein
METKELIAKAKKQRSMAGQNFINILIVAVIGSLTVFNEKMYVYFFQNDSTAWEKSHNQTLLLTPMFIMGMLVFKYFILDYAKTAKMAMEAYLENLIDDTSKEISLIAKDLVLNPEPQEVRNHYIMKIEEKTKEILSIEAAIKELADIKMV